MKRLASFQKWVPFKEVLSDGIIRLKDNTLVKLIKIFPINYELKSELEKKSILNSYKTFLKTFNFNLQILVQSKKENLKKQILILEQEKKIKKETNAKNIYEQYIEYIKKINSENKSSSKNFFIIIHQTDN